MTTYRQTMIDSGLSSSDASLCDDLAKHAVKEALAVMERITGTALTGRLRLITTLAAFGMLEVALEKTSETAEGLIARVGAVL